MKNLKSVFFFLIAAWMGLNTLGWACPMCKESLPAATGTGGHSLAQGFYWSILLMMGVAAAVTGWIIFLIVQSERQRSKRSENVSNGPFPSPSNG